MDGAPLLGFALNLAAVNQFSPASIKIKAYPSGQGHLTIQDRVTCYCCIISEKEKAVRLHYPTVKAG